MTTAQPSWAFGKALSFSVTQELDAEAEEPSRCE
jgi:hypothetical protein